MKKESMLKKLSDAEMQKAKDEDNNLEQKMKDIDGLIQVQSQCCTDPYMIGLYNGMILCQSILTGNKPVFFGAGVKKDLEVVENEGEWTETEIHCGDCESSPNVVTS